MAWYIHADVSDGGQVRSLMDGSVAAFGGLDILINNAAIVIFKRLVDTEEDEWDRVIATNLRGVYLCCRYAIPHMPHRHGGAVVNMSSARAPATTPLVSSYDTSKGGYRRADAELGARVRQRWYPSQLRPAWAVDTPRVQG